MPKIQAEDKRKLLPFTVESSRGCSGKDHCLWSPTLTRRIRRVRAMLSPECFKQVCERDAEFASFLKTFNPKADTKSDARKGRGKAVTSAA